MRNFFLVKRLFKKSVCASSNCLERCLFFVAARYHNHRNTGPRVARCVNNGESFTNASCVGRKVKIAKYDIYALK